LCDCRRFGVDVYWYDWSDAFQSLDMRLTNPSDPTVAALAGPVINDAFPMHWRDTYSVRLGYEWEPVQSRIWRTGYVYHRSPVPDGTLTPYLDGVLEHAVSVGHSRLTKYGWVNLAYQYTWGPTRSVDTSSIVGGDFSNSRLEAGAHWLCISLRR
jgi:long-subunit fatty acid transport protein